MKNNRKKLGMIIVLGVLIVLAGVTTFVLWNKKKNDNVQAKNKVNERVKELNYSKFYSEDGTLNWLSGDVLDNVTLCDYEQIDLMYSDLNLPEDAAEDEILIKLERYFSDYIVDCSQFFEMNDEFVENQREILKYEMRQDYNLDRAAGELSLGTTYDSIYDYYGMTKSEYKTYLTEQANKEAALAVAIEGIFKKEQLTLTKEDLTDYLIEQGYLESDFEVTKEEYGVGYLSHVVMQDKVIKLLCEHVTLTKD